MNLRHIFSIIAVLLLLPCSLFAETELSYDDGSAETYFSTAAAGTIEGIMFYPEHPAVLKTIKLMFSKTGNIQIHVWKDGGGNDPVTDGGDLITPIEYTVDEPGVWEEFDIYPSGVIFEKPEYVHVGVVRRVGGTGLKIDSSAGGLGYSYVYYPNDVAKYGIEGDFMVRLTVDYFNISDTRSFENVTVAAGLSGSSRPAWGDYDNDGNEDLLASAASLFHNNGDGTFTDVSLAAGISAVGGSGVWGDFDNDGFLDYYAFNGGTTLLNCDRLVKNNGDGTFTVLDPGPGTPYDFDPTEAAAWADYDRDGFIDLYVANYEKPGEELAIGTPDRLWKNMGGWFEDVSESSGIHAVAEQCGRGLAWADFDDDGDPDLYVSNYRLDPNFLWLNNGDGTFTDVSRARGVQGISTLNSYGHTIGSAWGDFNNDGYLDLFAANLAHPRYIGFSDKSMLYISSGPPDYTFTDIREAAGITYAETHSSPVILDYDNDGLLDLYITAIYSTCYSFMYRNNGDLTFEDTSYVSGTRVFNGWGASTADFNNDGYADLMTNALFRNNGGSNHWLRLKLSGNKSNRACIGCRATLTRLDGVKLVREVAAGVGTGSMDSYILHWGLGADESILSLEVRWTDGSVSSVESRNLEVDRLITLMEPYEEGQCVNTDSACLSDARVRICHNLQWVELDCPAGTYCENSYCRAWPVEEEIESESEGDGDLDSDTAEFFEIENETDSEETQAEIEPESAEADAEISGEIILEDESEAGNEIADNDEAEADGDLSQSEVTEMGGGCTTSCLPSDGILIILALALCSLFAGRRIAT